MQEYEKELSQYLSSLIDEVDQNYTEWYRNSEFYRKPSLAEVVGERIADLATSLKTALSFGDTQEIIRLIKVLEDAAKDYGRSWYDDDLVCLRVGCEYETKVCVKLRNIAAKSVSEKELCVGDFYEGFGV